MLRKGFYRLAGIREGEERRALLMFVYIFLLLLTINILKPIRNSLFLTKFGASHLPYAYILVAVSAALFISIYSRISKNARLNRLILASSFFSFFVMVLFWFLLKSNIESGRVIYLFYIWEAIVAVVWVTQFWLLAGYVFNAREARRVFGFLGAGAIAGSITGGYLTSYAAPILGTKDLILLSVLPLFGCLIILGIMWQISARASFQEKIRQRKPGWSERQESPLRLILRSRHLTYLACLIGVGVIVSNLVDYQYSALVTKQVKNQEALTSFLGFWLSNLSVISLLIQMFLTSRILLSLGVGTSLYLLPMGVLTGTFTILIHPALWSGVFTKVTEGAFKFSINRSGLELLFVPVPPAVKNQTKPFIDVFVDSFANGIGGLLLIVFSLGLGFAPEKIGYITTALVAAWIVLIARMKKEYLNSFRLALEKRSIDLEQQSVDLKDQAVLDSIISVLKGNNERQILYALRLIENSKSELLVPHLSRLLSHPSREIKAQVLGMILNYPGLDFTAEAHALAEDPDFEVQVGAIRYLANKSSDKLVSVNQFLDSKNYRARCAALMYAASEWNRDKDFKKRFNLKESLDTIGRELDQQNFSSDEKESLKVNLAEALGTANDPELHPYLTSLLDKGSPRLVEAAVQSAGKTRGKEFIPFLIKSLNEKTIRKNARKALAEYGEQIIDVLEAQLSNNNLRIRIPGVLALIPSQKSVDILQKNLEDKDQAFRNEVLKALNKLRASSTTLKFNQEYIEKKVIHEATEYYEVHSLYQRLKGLLSQKRGEPAVERAQQLLLKALQERLMQIMERIFRLLGLEYQPEDMFIAYRASVSSRKDLKANAVEFLDNVLNSNLKKYILPILEPAPAESLRFDGKKNVHDRIPSETESIHSILESDDKWLVVCALYLIAESKNRELASSAGKLLNNPDPTVRETVTYAMEKLQFPS
jgi:AAA family ATP:ADP antiporter